MFVIYITLLSWAIQGCLSSPLLDLDDDNNDKAAAAIQITDTNSGLATPRKVTTQPPGGGVEERGM